MKRKASKTNVTFVLGLISDPYSYYIYINVRKYHKRAHGLDEGALSLPLNKKMTETVIPLESPQEQLQVMEKEISNVCPRDDILVALMTSSFSERSLIEAKKSVAEILQS